MAEGAGGYDRWGYVEKLIAFHPPADNSPPRAKVNCPVEGVWWGSRGPSVHAALIPCCVLGPSAVSEVSALLAP